jgi:hypothetical protein
MIEQKRNVDDRVRTNQTFPREQRVVNLAISCSRRDVIIYSKRDATTLVTCTSIDGNRSSVLTLEHHLMSQTEIDDSDEKIRQTMCV